LVVKINTYGRKITSVTANNSELDFDCIEYPYEEDAWKVQIHKTSLSSLPQGHQPIAINYDSNESSIMNINVIANATPSSLTIIAPFVSHGNSVLLILPTGKTMLIDCGDATWRDRVVIPLLQNNSINKLDYFILTHYEPDHDSGDRGETIKSIFEPEHFYDYNDFVAGETFELEQTQIKILNVSMGAADENINSLSFKLEYNGFIYNHGGDIYSSNQQTILTQFPDDIKAHVFSANHHFHGSLSSEYIRTMDPYLVFIQAQQAIYARSAYTQTYKVQTEEWLKENNKRLIETLPTVEIGTVVIRANSADDWTYETYGDTETPDIPYIPQTMHLYED
jgi:beta-lactamase superfamily II metal-dependent hydrolase